MKVIDPHIHVFDLTKGEYNWLKPENPPFWPDKSVITRNFSVDSLQLTTPLELAGFVHIEAGFDNEKPWREIQWLESTVTMPFRTVACIDLTLNSASFLAHLSELKKYSSVIGCRHIFDDNAGSLLSNRQVINNLQQLANNDLLFELQMSFNKKTVTNLLAKKLQALPHLTVVINHAGFPDNNAAAWQANLKIVAKHKQCFIKCSGWEMNNRNYDASFMREIINQCVNIFGLSRVMLASNFPLVLFSQPYQALWQQYLTDLLLNETELLALMFNNAKSIYRLNA